MIKMKTLKQIGGWQVGLHRHVEVEINIGASQRQCSNIQSQHCAAWPVVINIFQTALLLNPSPVHISSMGPFQEYPEKQWPNVWYSLVVLMYIPRFSLHLKVPIDFIKGHACGTKCPGARC